MRNPEGNGYDTDRDRNEEVHSIHNYLPILRKEIGLRLREAQKDSGLSLEVFARSLGVSKSALNRYISGKNEPRVSLVHLLREKFKVNPNWFITGSGPRYLEEVGEAISPYGAPEMVDPILREVVERLLRHPEVVQILHRLLQVEPTQREAMEAYLMALEIALRAQR